MRLLLDTHVLLWALNDDPTLPAAIRRTIIDPANHVFISAVTAWEIAIKKALGKLQAPDNLMDTIHDAGFTPLSVTIPHALAVEILPHHHGDPFDRLLVAQTQLEGCSLVTRDAWLSRYNIPVLAA